MTATLARGWLAFGKASVSRALRQRKRRHRAATFAVAQRDVSSPRARELTRYRQAQAAARRAAQSGAAAVEALEHRLTVLGREPGAAVANLDPPRRACERHTRSSRGVAQGVLDEHVERAIGIRLDAPDGSAAELFALERDLQLGRRCLPARERP